MHYFLCEQENLVPRYYFFLYRSIWSNIMYIYMKHYQFSISVRFKNMKMLIIQIQYDNIKYDVLVYYSSR